jgi:hypothetical protein
LDAPPPPEVDVTAVPALAAVDPVELAPALAPPAPLAPLAPEPPALDVDPLDVAPVVSL